MKNFLIYKSSAGAGKTYTLVRNYLFLAFSPTAKDGLETRFSRILAITFTNKAAAEMKERILSCLREIIIDGSDSNMAGDLCKDLNIQMPELQARAQVVHRAILHNYSDLSVCTIDSFMHRVVRTFAHDLDIPVNFNVQIENQEIIQAAVDQLFQEVGPENKDLTDMLTSFIEMRIARGESYKVEGNITSLCEELFGEKAPHYLEQLKDYNFAKFTELQKDFNAKNEAFEQSIVDAASQIKTILDDHNLAPADFAWANRGDFYNYFSNLSEGNMAGLHKRSRVGGQMEKKKITPNKDANAEVRETLNNIVDDILPLYETIDQLCLSELLLYNTRRALLSNMLSLALMNHLKSLVDQYSVENEVLHISEFNKRISSVIKDDDVSPYIYERLGNRYINFLIDEFQDTSYLQWHNLVPLLANGVSQGHRSLVVGDAKQAIYRFRQGDVRQFLNLPRVDDSNHSFSLVSSGQVDNLPCNRRSRQHVVTFNNEFFGWLKDQEPYASHQEISRIYENHEQEFVRLGGCVRLDYCDEEYILEQVYQSVVKMVQELGYQYRDIAIIAYKKNDLSRISDFLASRRIADQEIPMVSAESFLLSNSLVVHLVRHLMGYLLNPDDKVAALHVLDLLRSLGKLPNDCYDRLVDNDALRLEVSLREMAEFNLDVDLLSSLPLYDCVEHLLRIFGLDGIDTAYVSTLLNFINTYSRTHRQDLAEFLEFFDDKFSKLSSSTAGDLDAISLFTIHKAKGLEANVIIYPIFRDSNKSTHLWVETSNEQLGLPVGWISSAKEVSTLFDSYRDEESSNVLMDRLNLLYVALTRPKDKLLLICDEKANEFGEPLRKFADLQVKAGAMQKDDSGYQFGPMLAKDNEPKDEERKPLKSKSIPPQKVTMQRILFPEWESRVRIADQSTRRSLSENQSASIRRGLQIHEVLSRIIVPADQDAAVSTYSLQNELTPAESAEFLSELSQFLARPDVAPFFRSGLEVKTECPLVYLGHEYRIDRLVVDGDTIHIVDFKTGVPNLEHEKQVADYAAAIASMGHQHIETHLLYI